MSPSSSGSWASGPGDIIDLDRYMRGSVRPSRPLGDDTNQYERLVVDGGAGGARKPRSSASGDARCKRTSLDSGVWDGSYRRPRNNHTKHRRSSYQSDSFYPPHEPALTKTLSDRANSSSSMRAFRVTCEQALLEQQQQISRVAELCERLNERAVKTEKVELNEQSERVKEKQNERLSQQNVRSERKAPSVDSSDISSSSRSTKDPKRKDTNRTQECKTYKIIMSKLDELNRLYATRPPRATRPTRAARTPSSSSVSVCDKLVATDPQRTYNRVLAPTQYRMRCAGGPASAAPASVTSAARPSRHASARTVTHAYAVDIAPRDKKDARANVLTESIVKCESSSGCSHQSACDPRCGFDLEDPVHLYSQAKRLQSLNARERRTRSVEPACGDAWDTSELEREHVYEHARAPSLCALCRGYWRYLRQCVPALARAVDACKCS